MSQYKVLACGSNGSHQLGISNDDDQDILQPVLFCNIDGTKSNFIKSKPIKICSGGNHTFILLSTGELYSAGDNTYGQCGHPIDLGDTHIREFKIVSGNEKWTNVSCGWEFSILMNDQDEVYVCGLGLKGELGLGINTTRTELVKLPFRFPSKIVDLKSSINHTVASLANGHMYGWGNCRKGQLGEQESVMVNNRSKARPVVWEPEVLRFGAICIQAYDLGRDCTVILDNTQTVRIFGKGAETSNCGDGIVDLKSMWSSNHYLIQDETLCLSIKSTGNNSHGQLFPESHVDISKYEIGSEHGLILTKQNVVYAWGWGEHGNCGKHTDSTHRDKLELKVTFNYLNRLYEGDDRVILLGAGCATSWLCLQCK